MPQHPAPDLWHFACQLYQKKGVKDTCLELQNQNQADINLLLFCCWYGVHHGLITPTQWTELLDISHYWQRSILQPLRTVRQELKHKTALYQQTLALELNCEKSQLEAMESLTGNLAPPKPRNASNDNLSHYLVNILSINQSIARQAVRTLTPPSI